MPGIIREATLVSAYWFSLVLAGYGTVLLLKHVALVRARSVHVILDYVLDQSILGVFLMSFALEAALLGLISIPFYLLHWSATFYAVVYVLCGLIGWAYLALRLVKNLFTRGVIDFFKLNGELLITKLLFSALCIFLIADFIFSLYAGSDVLNGSDAYVHLARMVTMLYSHFGIQDGFLSGVDETRYHFNVIYALFVIPSRLFNISPAEVWRFSFAFFRLLQWMAIFTLAWHVSAKWLEQGRRVLFMATTATLFAAGYYSGVFFVATYPNQIVNLWFVLLIMGVSYYESSDGASILPALIPAFLVTMTHPTYALMAVILVAFVILIRVLLEKRQFIYNTPGLYFYGKLAGVLALGPLVTFALPNRMTAAAYDFGDFPTVKVIGLSIFKPYNFLRDTPLQLSLLLIGTIGLWYLAYRLWSRKREWALVAALIIFYPLLVYEPIGFGVLHSRLPLWLIQRFNYMNVLNYVAMPVGMVALVDVSTRLLRSMRVRRILSWRRLAYAAPTLALLAISMYLVAPNHKILTINHAENKHYYSFIARTYDDFHSVIHNNDVVLANTGDSYFLPAVLPVKTVAIYSAHATPMADEADRLKCQSYLMDHLSYGDLKTVGVTTIVLSYYDANASKEMQLANSEPYLKEVATNQDFAVYRFTPNLKSNERSIPYPACVAYQKIEG